MAEEEIMKEQPRKWEKIKGEPGILKVKGEDVSRGRELSSLTNATDQSSEIKSVA